MKKSKRDFISIEQVDRSTLEHLIDRSIHFFTERRNKNPIPQFLNHFSVATFFLENSTRTRTSFEFAASLGGASLVSIPTATSSLTKGETLSDTLCTFDAMHFDAIILRQTDNDFPFEIAPKLKAALINAGAGTRAHPSQALLDAAVMKFHFGTLEGLSVSICGDIIHSRVASSLLQILPLMGVKITLVGPKSFLPDSASLPKGVTCVDDMDQGIKGADVVYCLRVQKERMSANECPDATKYLPQYGLTQARLKTLSPHSIVLHPGPINRGMEIESSITDCEQCHILTQVEMGVAARMAILEWVAQ